MQDKVADY